MSKQEQKNGETFAHLYTYSGANKAGMDGIDKNEQARIIYENSKDSAYFKRASKQDEETLARVQNMKQKLIGFTGSIEERTKKEVDRFSADLESRRCFRRICCVLDMDMFFAAVEIRDQPQLKDLPVAVGGMGMISTSNYVARKFGVRAAMPGFIARKLCPNLVFVRSNFDKYQVVADQIRSIIAEYDPNFSSHSLDEVYFDLTAAVSSRLNLDNGSENEHGLVMRATGVTLLHEIRTRIKEKTGGLTCSAGMANNFFLAKICADVNKPDGQFELSNNRESVVNFVSNLPTRKVGGIGKVTERFLEQLLGITTMSDVRQHIAQLFFVCTPALGQFLLRTSLGIDSEEGTPQWLANTGASDSSSGASQAEKKYHRKSLGCERTFSAAGISDQADLLNRLRKICEHVAVDMAKEELRAKSVTLKLKDVDFRVITKCVTSSTWFQTAEAIEEMARPALLEQLPMSVRLLGVQVSKFQGENLQSGSEGERTTLLRFLDAHPSTGPIGGSNSGMHSNSGNNSSNSSSGSSSSSSSSSNSSSSSGVGPHEGGAATAAFGSYLCPICDREVESDKSLVRLNAHIDVCLQRSEAVLSGVNDAEDRHRGTADLVGFKRKSDASIKNYFQKRK